MEFSPTDRHSLLRGTEAAKLLRAEPVDELFAEHVAVSVDIIDIQEVSNYEASLAFLRFLHGAYAEASALWEKAARDVSINASGDLPRAARAAIWAGDRVSADRVIAYYAAGWVHGPVANARYAGLTACIAALDGHRDEAVAGFSTSIARLRELGLEVDAVLFALDMARTLGPADPAVGPWLDEARATIERLRMPGLNGLLEAATGSGEAVHAAEATG